MGAVEAVYAAPVKPRREASTSTQGNDGPITKVKRKRLDSLIAEPNQIPKKKTVSKKKVVVKSNTDDVVKTRRVVTYSDDEK